jgi:hypothetical protein
MSGKATRRRIASPIISHPDLQKVQDLVGVTSNTSFSFLHLLHIPAAHMNLVHKALVENLSQPPIFQRSDLPNFSLSFVYFLYFVLLHPSPSLSKTAVTRFVFRISQRGKRLPQNFVVFLNTEFGDGTLKCISTALQNIACNS